MLRRLLFLLLLACLALPATAAMSCHDGGTATMMMMPDGPVPHHHKAAAHICIGCVPPSSWRTAPDLAPPLMISEAPPVAVLARLDLGRAAPPATPPPRRAA